MSYKVKELRQKRTLTQTELAKLSGVSRATIADIESGSNRKLQRETAKKLARVLRVKPSDLTQS